MIGIKANLKENLNCLIGLVGGYASACAEECLSHEWVDAVLKGEYEQSAYNFVTSPKKRIYDYNFTQDLNTLPFPERRENPVTCIRQDLASSGIPNSCFY